MSYHVKPVKNRRGMKDFLELPMQIYDEDSNWVTPLKSKVRRTLDSKHNPFFRDAELRLFSCYKGIDAVARASVVINRNHWKRFGKRTAFFGFFESVADEKAASCLFDAMGHYCSQQGAEELEGPFNPNHYSELGLLGDNFNSPPAFFETYNPPYYGDLLEAAGFRMAKELHTRRNTEAANYARQRHGAPRPVIHSGGFTVRTLNPRGMTGDLERIRDVFNDAFSHNWHFLPLTSEEYRYAAAFLRYVTHPELIAIVERNGEPVGAVQCVPDINPLLRSLNGRLGPIGCLKYFMGRRKIRDLVIFAVGVKPAYRHSRAYKLLLDAVRWMSRDCRTLSTTWMDDDNHAAIRAAEHLGLKPYKHFAIYAKPIDITPGVGS